MNVGETKGKQIEELVKSRKPKVSPLTITKKSVVAT